MVEVMPSNGHESASAVSEHLPAVQPGTDPHVQAPWGSDKVRAAMIASVVGNVLEWFDFGVFAFLSPQIGVLFFPAADRFVSTLNTYVVFGGGFVFRPLGGILLAHIGDVYGRKVALLVSVVGMAGATFAMGCLPTYEDIGPLAPVILCSLRLIQGLSVGGEFVGSIVFAVESMPQHRRVFGGTLCMCGAIAGLTLGAATGLVLHSLFTPDQILAFGWRIPFWCGLLIGLFALWLRYEVRVPGPSRAPPSPSLAIPLHLMQLSDGSAMHRWTSPRPKITEQHEKMQQPATQMHAAATSARTATHQQDMRKKTPLLQPCAPLLARGMRMKAERQRRQWERNARSRGGGLGRAQQPACLRVQELARMRVGSRALLQGLLQLQNNFRCANRALHSCLTDTA